MNAIELTAVSKRFYLRAERRPALQDAILRWLATRGTRRPRREFWALQDVTFSIAQGESFGLIGRNGAGKSTVLKLIAHTLAPTKGSVVVNGRVAGLIGLGAGFHPDLTGLQNIYLDSAFRGLSRRDVTNRLESIMDLADIGDYIREPVRHYSSGMYLRLAFAVAIHTPADILLFDEVLAVGDEAFQRRCLAEVEARRHAGCTILFVAHSTVQMQQVCERAAWIEGGRLWLVDDVSAVTDAYLDATLGMRRGRPSRPLGAVDSPTVDLRTSELGGEVLVAGWAIDNGATTGTGVDRVRVFVGGKPYCEAEYGLQRPDVATIYGERFMSCGFGCTFALPDSARGESGIEVYARSTVTGDETMYKPQVAALGARQEKKELSRVP